MSDTQLEKGDLVTVVMARNDVFPWQVGPSFKAVFRRWPQGPGDTYRLTVADTVVELNGNSTDFIALVRDGNPDARGGGGAS